MALSAAAHHSFDKVAVGEKYDGLRAQTTDRAGEAANKAPRRQKSKAAGEAVFFELFDEDTAGVRPEVFADPRKSGGTSRTSCVVRCFWGLACGVHRIGFFGRWRSAAQCLARLWLHVLSECCLKNTVLDLSGDSLVTPATLGWTVDAYSAPVPGAFGRITHIFYGEVDST